MVNWERITTTSMMAVRMVILKAIAAYVVLLSCTRISSLRSFAKMSSFDFAITVAVGSLLAATIITKSPPFLQSMVALAILFSNAICCFLGQKSISGFYSLDLEFFSNVKGRHYLASMQDHK